MRWKRFTWEWALRAVGLVGIAHETLIVQRERPTLLLLFAAMVGLPSLVRADEKRNKRDS